MQYNSYILIPPGTLSLPSPSYFFPTLQTKGSYLRKERANKLFKLEENLTMSYLSQNVFIKYS